MAHPTVPPVLADLPLVEKPHRPLTDTVNGAFWVHLAQVQPLRPTRVTTLATTSYTLVGSELDLTRETAA
jgi:hypothetical protein